jgi:hypothetical protein
MEDIKKWHEAIKRPEDKRTGEEDRIRTRLTALSEAFSFS